MDNNFYLYSTIQIKIMLHSKTQNIKQIINTELFNSFFFNCCKTTHGKRRRSISYLHSLCVGSKAVCDNGGEGQRSGLDLVQFYILVCLSACFWHKKCYPKKD